MSARNTCSECRELVLTRPVLQDHPCPAPISGEGARTQAQQAAGSGREHRAPLNLHQLQEVKKFFSGAFCVSEGVLSQVVQTVKNLPAVRDTRVQFLGREGALEEETATPSNIPAWRSPWTEEPGGLQSTGSQRLRHA